jgi:hypothetical protein
MSWFSTCPATSAEQVIADRHARGDIDEGESS